LVNIRTGGRTRISGMLHALLLLAIVLGLGPLAAQIPHAALAGILVKVGWDIVDWSYLKNAHRGPRWDLLLMALVLGLTVFVDLITAVAVGVVLGSIAYVRQVAQAQIKAIIDLPPGLDSDEEAELLSRANDRIQVFDFGGPLSFGAAADLGHHVRERSRRTRTEVLILDFSRVPSIDVSAARAVETIACDARQMGKKVYCTGLRDEVGGVLSGLNADHCIDVDCRRFERRIDALRAAVEQLERNGAPATAPAS